MSSRKEAAARALWSPAVRGLHAYVPGEQPQGAGWIKLNTNECPYPPSPLALRRMAEAVDERLRLYPDPSALALIILDGVPGTAMPPWRPLITEEEAMWIIAARGNGYLAVEDVWRRAGASPTTITRLRRAAAGRLP